MADVNALSCPCACHGGGSFAACTVVGGCGHLHEQFDESLLCRRGKACADARVQQVSVGLVDNHGREPEHQVRRRVGAKATAPDGLCRMCTTHVQRAVEQLPADYEELSRLLAKAGGEGGPPVSGSRELKVPIRLDVEALQAAILDEVERWAWPVAEQAGFWLGELGRPAHRVAFASSWIAHRLHVLLGLPPMAVKRIDGRQETVKTGRNPHVSSDEDGVHGALQLLELHERVAAVAGRTQRAHRMTMPCPQCERAALERRDGDGHVDCRRCGHRMTLETYEERANVLGRQHGLTG